LEYNAQNIEKKWQDIWEKEKPYKAVEDKSKKKYYCLEMFPYPSGKLHMGHVRNYSIGDAISRYKALKGFNVLHPIGWDSFGLPAENAAIKHNVHPASWTMSNIDVMRGQFKRLGFSYDWDREIATCAKEYYKWEQLFFIKMYEKGLAYKKTSTVNWCQKCSTVLANEQVENGKCWRCREEISTKELDQWFFKITAYAEELLSDIDEKLSGWPERVKLMQKNWIGKSHGVKVNFKIKKINEDLEIYTTRPDTIYGVTFMSLAPEHPIINKLIEGKKEKEKVEDFIKKVRKTTKIERTAEGGLKEGVFTGSYAINPLTGDAVPIYVANFVLMDYGTGAVMAVPAHDERDFDFAKKYSIPIKRVIYKKDPKEELKSAYIEDGIMINSSEFDGMKSTDAKTKIANLIEEKKLGKKTINYRLKDWGISRQRFWGTPIPIVYCKTCGVVPVSIKDLPVVLPKEAKLENIGDNPLSKVKSFVNTKCPKCGEDARRETDTMDTFVESSWYYARYVSPKDNINGINKDKANYWLPVDQYIGGIEHAVMHLLYVRFFHKVLRDFGYFNTDEPAKNLLTQGMVLKDGGKMSKSIGNVVDPDYIIKKYGCDTARLFTLFASPPKKDLDWSDKGVEGCHRFLNRVWRFIVNNLDIIKVGKEFKKEKITLKDLNLNLNKTIDKVTTDLNNFHLNTAVSSMMELTNELYKVDMSKVNEDDKGLLKKATKSLILMLSPFCPHISSELWEKLEANNILKEIWPSVDKDSLKTDSVLIIVQVNGKLRARINIAKDLSKEELEKQALEEENVKIFTKGKDIKKIIYVKEKLINIVV
jgi:leucyl-tRNA synthetase